MNLQPTNRELSMWTDNPDPIPVQRLSDEIRADYLIIGGGFTGLSAAYHLKRLEPSASIVVIEAQHVGSGASGRNTGILRPGVGRSLKHSIRRFGTTTTQALYQASVNAIGYAKQLIATEELKCDWQDVPHARAALSIKQCQLLRDETEILLGWNQKVEYLEEQTMAYVAPRHYFGGVCYHDAATINPALFCRELKRVLVSLGVQVFEESPVCRLDTFRGVRAQTPHGRVSATRVLIATNGYASQLGILPGNIIPLQTHLCVTEPLTLSQLQQLGWQGHWTFADKRNLFHYYRLTPDRRLMYGGGKPLYASDPAGANHGGVDLIDERQQQQLRNSMQEEFPSLRDVAIKHQWSGTLGMNLQEIPLLTEIESLPGACYFGGWSGHGVAMSIASGKSMAIYLTRGDQEESATMRTWRRPQGIAIPGDPWRRWALNAQLQMLSWLDSWESAWQPAPKLLLRRSNPLCDTPELMGFP